MSAGVPYAHIAVCIDDSEASMRALAEARRLRALGPGRLSLVHVAPAPLMFRRGGEGWEPDPRDLNRVAARWLEEVAASVPEGEPVLSVGHPPTAVVEWAREARPDLLVAAAHRGPVERILLGSFAGHLAHHAPCSVLLVRPREGGPR